MSRIAKTLGCLAVAALCSVPLVAEDKPAAQPGGMPQMSPEMQAEMDAWMKAGTPGKEHQQLAAMAGDWKAMVKSYMGGPEPSVSPATVHREMVLDGRVLDERFSGEMMGTKFEGHAMIGYDNASGQYWSTWNDSLSTGLMVAYGKWDDAAKAVVFDGTMTDPHGKPIKVRMVTHTMSPTEQQFEYWEERGGKLTKTMEMTLVKQ